MLDTSPLKRLTRNAFLYGIIGCIAAGTDTLIFFILTNTTPLAYLQANAISVITGIFISFTLNRKYNFKVTDHPIKRGAIFFCVGFIGLLISQFLLWLGTSAGLEPIISKLISVVVVAVVQFTLNKLLSFGLKL